MKKAGFLLLLCAGFCIACEKVLVDENPPDTPQANFESMWQTIDRKYSFFELKNINWDSVYTVFEPQIKPDMSERELFAVLDSMLYLLRDGHVNLVSPFNLSRNWQWYLDYPNNFDYELVERHYLGPDHKRAGGLQYTLLDSIGYVYYPSFSSSLSTENLNAVINFLEKKTKGVIVDVRSNGGGSLNNAYALASRFATSQKQVLITYEKTGPGHNDFGNGLSRSLSPSDKVNYQKPVALLINRRCYSATNTFAALLSNYPHITIIGDTTGGGGGLPIDQELPNGWRYRFSATAALLPNGYNIEQGIPPDINLDLDTNQALQGQDNIIEKAKQVLR